MHVGHLCYTIIGEVYCYIVEYFGHTVDCVNHVRYWGIQFGMLMQYLEENFLGDKYPNIMDLTEF